MPKTISPAWVVTELKLTVVSELPVLEFVATGTSDTCRGVVYTAIAPTALGTSAVSTTVPVRPVNSLVVENAKIAAPAGTKFPADSVCVVDTPAIVNDELGPELFRLETIEDIITVLPV